MSWSSQFDEPIPLPDSSEIKTLREAGDYIIALPEREHGCRIGRPRCAA
jgi:hypothetical protein